MNRQLSRCGACRRDLLSRAVRIGAFAYLGRLAVGPNAGAFPELGQDDPATTRPVEGDLLVRVDDADAKPLTAADIPTDGKPVLAWPLSVDRSVIRNGSRLNRVLLTRFDETRVAPDTRARAASGVVAYTSICTHNGCEVNEWLADKQLLHCGCHYTLFDPSNGARVVDGPAPRPLPALPLEEVDGVLSVAAPFTSRVGYESV